MRDRSPDVMAVQPPIERQRGGEGFDLGQTRARKAAANQALGSIGASARRFGGGVCERCLKGDAWAARFHRELEGSRKSSSSLVSPNTKSKRAGARIDRAPARDGAQSYPLRAAKLLPGPIHMGRLVYHGQDGHPNPRRAVV